MSRFSIVFAATLLLGACGTSQYDPYVMQQNQANTGAWGRWAMDRYNPPVVYTQPSAPISPHCYHVMANGRCAHWGP